MPFISRITLFIVFTFFSFFLFSNNNYPKGNTLVIEGNYYGKNIFVQNAFSQDGVGFCVKEVSVNGSVTTDEINSNNFEIDLGSIQLKIGDAVLIKIKHQKGCKPQILNPEALLPKSTFELVSIEISGKNLLKWTTKQEQGKLNFYIEEFRWNKWVRVGEVSGKGLQTINNYRFRLVPHSGENKYRVKQIGMTGKPRYSKSIKFISTTSEITYSHNKEKLSIDFSNKSKYEIYDFVGKIIKKGFSKSIDIKGLKKGIYYLNFDNKSVSVIIK